MFEDKTKSLEGEFDNYKIVRNQPRPLAKGWAKVADKWDRLMTKLEAGDEWRMSKTEANSFANRAAKAGFVVVKTKTALTDQQIRDGIQEWLVWFGGRKTEGKKQ